MYHVNENVNLTVKHIIQIIIDDSAATGDKIIKETKTVPTKAFLSKSTSTKAVLIECTSTNFYNLLAFLLMIVMFLIAVTVYC